MTDDTYRTWAAAYVLGALGVDERAEYESHLEHCESCQRDVLDFSPIPALLSAVDESDLSVEPFDVTSGVLLATGTQQAVLRRSRSRWRTAALGAVAAALILAGVAVAANNERDSPVDRTAGVELAVSSPIGATGTISVSARPWGSVIVIDLFDVPRRDQYTMWTVSNDGLWAQAASWSWSEAGTCRIPGTTPLQSADIARVVVTGVGDKSDELAAGSPA